MMPQSLHFGDQSPTGAFKRQRSADSRDLLTQASSAGQSELSVTQLRANVRVPAYLQKTKREISNTFQDLEWKQRFRLFHALENPDTSPFRVDRSDVVVSRNRYGNVQPWDEVRIKLKTPIGGSDYVNASPIVLKSKGPDDKNDSSSLFRETKYIATQGPKSGQYSHFWHMVHQETTGDVGVVVMLTRCYEANKEKCAEYFPMSLDDPVTYLPLHESGEEESETAGPSSESSSSGTVTLVSSDQDTATGCEARQMDVRIDGVTKRIHHFLFTGWPDFGKPEADERTALLNLTRKSRELAGSSPRIIHCSAGVGRTGAFIALDFLVREIEEGRFIDNSLYPTLKSPIYAAHPHHSVNQQVTTPMETWGRSGPPKVFTPTTDEGFGADMENQAFREDLIYSTVNTLRSQRMMMVMNEVQFAFLYEVIKDVFWNKYKMRTEGATVRAAGSGTVGPSDGPPRSKVVKVEGDGNVSEAETEIMEEGDHIRPDRAGKDPYDAVAPEHIQEGLRRTPD